MNADDNDDDEGTAQWFGAPWGAGINEMSAPVETPVGELCLWCHEPIHEGDRGFLILHVARENSGYRPSHLRCVLRTMGLDERGERERKEEALRRGKPDPSST